MIISRQICKRLKGDIQVSQRQSRSLIKTVATHHENARQKVTIKVQCFDPVELDTGIVLHRESFKKKSEISTAIFVSRSLIDKLVIELVFKKLGLQIQFLIMDSVEGAACETIAIYHASVYMAFCGVVFFDADCYHNDKNILGEAVDLYLQRLNEAHVRTKPHIVIMFNQLHAASIRTDTKLG